MLHQITKGLLSLFILFPVGLHCQNSECPISKKDSISNRSVPVKVLPIDQRPWQERKAAYASLFYYPSGYIMSNQTPDSLLINGEQADLDYSPLCDFIGISPVLMQKYAQKMIGYQSNPPGLRIIGGTSFWSMCNRGYIAQWAVDNGKLYLKDVLLNEVDQPNGFLPRDTINKRIEQATGRRFDSAGRLWADWVSGELTAITLGSANADRFDQKEFAIKIKNGAVVDLTVTPARSRINLPLDKRSFKERKTYFNSIYGYANGSTSNRRLDTLRSGRKTMLLDYSPLLDFKGIRKAIIQDNAPRMTSRFSVIAKCVYVEPPRNWGLFFECDRGYTARWIIKGRKLYLGKVSLCTFDQYDKTFTNNAPDSVLNPPQKIIDRRVEQATGRTYDANGLILADWVNDDLTGISTSRTSGKAHTLQIRKGEVRKKTRHPLTLAQKEIRKISKKKW